MPTATDDAPRLVDEPPAWHAMPLTDVEQRLGTSPDGLTGAEAALRLARHGPNQLTEEAPPAAWRVLLRQFRDPLILILAGAAVVTVVMGELMDTALIALALVLNAVIGFTQEQRAAGAVRALMRLVVPRSRVVRDGRQVDVDSPELVPGDLVVLEPGTRVPADLRLTFVNALDVDESLLTGESLPVAKRDAPVGPRTIVADRRSMAFTGTIVTSGRGQGYVVATGHDTELGSIAGLIRTEIATESPLRAAMDGFARVIVVAILVAATVTFVSGVLLGETIDHMFHVAVAMAVSAVPEGLPVAVTVTLAIGVSRMARRHAVLRRLPALGALGSTTVVGSDKTGTLTENRMGVQSIWSDGRVQRLADLGIGATPEGDDTPTDPAHLALVTGVLTNEAHLTDAGDGPVATGDPTEVALLLAARDTGIDPGDLRDRHPVDAEIPFESERRYSATIRRHGEGHAVFVKGAPERIIEMCTRVMTAEGPVPLDRASAQEAARAMAADGLRVLGMAYRPLRHLRIEPLTEDVPPAEGLHWVHDADGVPIDPDDLILVGLQGMEDPPREGVAEAIVACREAGVRVVMITGDHSITARSIAARLGIVERPDAPVVTGSDLAGLDDAGLERTVAATSVFARVAPDDKLRIVRTLQGLGHVVVVTGDGVNDAPALRVAEVGVSMGRDGTDVAREASDMVLSDDNFVSIVAAIEEGRISYANIRKVSFFLVSTAAAETAAIMLSVWLGWPLLLVPAQILWLNLVTNGVQDLALAFEPGSDDVLRRPPRPRHEGIMSALMWERTALVGLVMAVGALAMFRWELDQGGSLEQARSVALTTLVLFNVFQAGNARSEHRSLFRLSPFANPFLLWASVGAIGLYLAALHLPLTQYVLSIEPIAAAAWGRALLVASSALVVVEGHKAIRRRWPRKETDP